MNSTTISVEKVTVLGNKSNLGKPLYIVNGTLMTESIAKSIDPDKIESVNVLKGDQAISKYGENGNNGAIEITLKERVNMAAIEDVTVVGNEKTSDLKTPPSPLGFNIRSKDSENPPLYVVDGTVINKRKAEYFTEVGGVESVNVLKGKSATDKYGDQGKNGVIELTLKKGVALDVPEDKYVVGYPITSHLKTPPSPIALNFNSRSNNSKNPPLYILDGVIIDKAKMDAINPETIESVSVLKDKSATDKYGEKAKEGVVEIKLKKEVEDHLKKSDEPFVVVEEMPQFVGGFNALNKFIGDNIQYPAQAKAEKAEGTVIANFVIRSTGKVENVRIERGVNALLDQEAARVIAIMPDWIPGKQHGKTVDVSYTIPIQFKLDGNDQKKTAEQQKQSIEPYKVVEEMPEFHGGQEAFMKFIIENVKYPPQAMKDNVQGKVLVNFIVMSSGKIENAKVIQSVNAELDNEALRVVKSMPVWKPGKQGGKVVDVEYTMPIQFKLQ